GAFQPLVLGTHLVQFLAHLIEGGVVIAYHSLAAVPSPLLEFIGQSDSGGQHAFTELSSALAVKTVIDEHSPYIEVQVECIAQTERVQYTYVRAHFLGRRRFPHHGPAETGIRAAIPNAFRIISTKQVGEVEQYIGMD